MPEFLAKRQVQTFSVRRDLSMPYKLAVIAFCEKNLGTKERLNDSYLRCRAGR